MKKIILPALALMLAVGFSAFTAPHAPKKGTTQYFYTYTGAQTVAARETPSNYVLSTNKTVDPLCTGTNECTVDILFTTGTEPSALSSAQNLTFDVNGFPTGIGTGGIGTFDKNEKKP